MRFRSRDPEGDRKRAGGERDGLSVERENRSGHRGRVILRKLGGAEQNSDHTQRRNHRWTDRARRADWAAQTVRAVVVLNTDGVADPPALTQTSGTTYEINLATFTITTEGEIGSLVVEPDRASFGSGLQYGDMTLSGWGILGNAGNTVDEAERIIPSGDGLPLNRNGTALEFGQIGTSGIAMER